MRRVPTLLMVRAGQPVESPRQLWTALIEPHLRTCGFQPDHWEGPLLADPAAPDGHTMLARLHAMSSRPLADGDLLLVFSTSIQPPDTLLARALTLAQQAPGFTPIFAIVYPRRTSYVLETFQTCPLLPLGVEFPGPVRLEQLARGARQTAAVARAMREHLPVRTSGVARGVTSSLPAPDREALGRTAQAQLAIVAEERLSQMRLSGTPEEQLGALSQLGHLRLLQGRLEEAARALSEALDLAVQVHDPAQELAVLSALARVDLDQGQLEGARKKLEQCLRLARDAGDGAAEGVALSNLGLVYREAGDLSAAERCLRGALELARAHCDVQGEYMTLSHLAIVYADQERSDLAAPLLNEVLRLAPTLPAME